MLSPDGDDDIMDRPRPRAMTAPSRIKPGRLDVSAFETKPQAAYSPGSKPRARQPKPLPASSLLAGSSDDGGKGVEKADVLPKGVSAVRDKTRMFEAPASSSPSLQTRVTSSPNIGTKADHTDTSRQTQPESQALSAAGNQGLSVQPTSTVGSESDFAKQSRQERIKYALELARSTDADFDQMTATAARTTSELQASSTGVAAMEDSSEDEEESTSVI